MNHLVTPYKDTRESKKEQVARMFNEISGTYDILNRLLSMGIDQHWRKEVLKRLKAQNPEDILDVATGTGDLAIEAAKLGDVKITGVDIAEQMLKHGHEKLEKAGVSHQVVLEYGDSENLTYVDQTFDAITVAFGVRNFENLDQGLAELYRVLKPSGQIHILEFKTQQTFPMKQLFGFYFRYILPFIGRLISENNQAYSYLPESVGAFPSGNAFLEHLKKAGFKNSTCTSLTLGICAIYSASK